ncbi:sensor histidine kinase [Paenibacillus sp. TAB 01]|uniref:sensor histidine kinase n=1 Tax=Paenibacillus sp. TAB 01 TaxID=3368988 RepID=UPI0037523254
MNTKIFFRLTLVGLVSLLLWFAYITFHYPYVGIILKQNEGQEWVIRKLDNDSASLKLNFQVGDRIRSVDNLSPGDLPSVRKWRTIEQAQTIVIEREGKEIAVVISEAAAKASTSYFPLFGEILCLSFAVLLYFKVKNSISGQFLSIVFVNIGLIFASLGASARGDSLGKIAITTLMMVFPIVFFHFFVHFVRERGAAAFPLHFLKYAYGFVALTLLCRMTFFFPQIAYAFYEYNSSIVIVFFLLGILLNFFYLSWIYVKYRAEESYVSVIIKTVLWAFAISFLPFISLSFLPQLLTGNDWVNSLYTSWFVLFFPMSFAYLILTKQLYDIDLVLRRILFTVVLSVVPGAVITFLNAFIFTEEASVRHLLISFCLVLAIISSVLYFLENFLIKLEAIVFPRKYHLQQALKKIATNLQSISSFRELKEIVLVDIVTMLQLYGAAIAFRHQDRIETVIEGEIDPDEVERIAALDLREHPELLCLEISRNEEYTSSLILTSKISRTVLGSGDVHWLNLIISYLAVSMENLHLIGKLNVRLQQLAAQMPNEQDAHDFMWFRKLMFDLQEAERKRIATDLHDTTLQDLFFLKKKFAAIMENQPSQDDNLEQMKSVIDYVEIINTNLRQSCFELHPHLLHEIGLLETIRKVIENESLLCPFELKFFTRGAEVVEAWDLEIKHHVFRIIQELLNNAKKHSAASLVSIVITRDGDHFLLMYEDNGVGFETGGAVIKEIGASGTGMEQMKSRVLHLDGQWKIRTSSGNGLRLWITIPIRKVQTA